MNSNPPAKTSLTARELQVARLLLASKTTGDISQILGIAAGTVSAHLSRVYSFYGVDSRVGFLNRVYATPELRRTLITEAIAMTDTVTPATLRADGAVSILSGRNAPDLSLKLCESAPYSYPLCLEFLNSALNPHMPQILRQGPLIWAGFLQGDLRFVIEQVEQIAPETEPHIDAQLPEAVLDHGRRQAVVRMTAWLHAVRAAALALCGSERQQTDAMSAAEASAERVASSQLLPWTMRVTRVFVYACATRSAAGLERLLQLTSEMDTFNPLRMYTLVLAVRLSHYIGPSERDSHNTAMQLLVAEADDTREEIQRRASATIFNLRSGTSSKLLGVGWI